MRTLRSLTLTLFCLAISNAAFSQTGHITAAEAKNHVGEKATVCGKVVDTHLASRSRGEPTFLNIDERYPKQIFTIVIWSSDRSKFGDPEAKYANKTVCVTGLIKNYRGLPEVVAEKPSQIEVQK